MGWFKNKPSNIRPLIEHLCGLLKDDTLWEVIGGDLSRRSYLTIKHINKDFSLIYNRYYYDHNSFYPEVRLSDKFDFVLNWEEKRKIEKATDELVSAIIKRADENKYNNCFETLLDEKIE